MGREYELKYAATPEILSKIRLEYPNFKTIQMETTYYDTMDGILGRLHWTVRRRLENGVSVCTVKTNLPDGSRGGFLPLLQPLLSYGQIRPNLTKSYL